MEVRKPTWICKVANVLTRDGTNKRKKIARGNKNVLENYRSVIIDEIISH